VVVVVVVAAASPAGAVPVVVVVVSVVVAVVALVEVLAASVEAAVLAPEVLGVLLSPLPLQAAREATRATLAPARAKFLRFNIRSIRLLLIPDEFVPLSALSD